MAAAEHGARPVYRVAASGAQRDPAQICAYASYGEMNRLFLYPRDAEQLLLYAHGLSERSRGDVSSADSPLQTNF